MSNATRISAALGCGAALVMATAGMANAAVVNAVPTGEYQMCGNVYSDAPWVENSAPPAAAVGVSGVEVNGELYPVFASTPTATYTATTDSEGRYCLQGDLAMVATVTFGGKVVLSATPTVDSNKWTTSGVNVTDFAAHQYGAMQSANNFHLVMP